MSSYSELKLNVLVGYHIMPEVIHLFRKPHAKFDALHSLATGKYIKHALSHHSIVDESFTLTYFIKEK